ncbi:helix-turn-helix transcriptional regulator [Arthrobacter pigmenti]
MMDISDIRVENMDIANASDLGRLVREHRSLRGITQTDLARLAGINRSTLVDLEYGRNTSTSTALKVLSLLGVNLSAASSKQKQGLRWTAAKAAREIKRELDAGDPAFAMRVLFMATDFLAGLNSRSRHEFLQEPPSTGRKRWDVLLARTLAYKCREMGVKSPAWTNAPPLGHTWYATPRRHVSEAWKQRMASNTPPELSEAKIFLDARELASV